MGIPNSWMVFVRENPNPYMNELGVSKMVGLFHGKSLSINGLCMGTPIYGNLHIEVVTQKKRPTGNLVAPILNSGFYQLSREIQ